ncbi:ribosomal RNA assembly protein krr1 [Dimargaris xerosporica]|nr:ribosomal RNA assembly protein krr1 [Dimargaris xerosporica]
MADEASTSSSGPRAVKFTKDDFKHPLLEESSFAVIFPKYIEKSLVETLPYLQELLSAHGIVCSLDRVEGSLSVRTTRKTFDPYMIIKARDLIALLVRSVPFSQATRILEDDMHYEIFRIGNIVSSKDTFRTRRDRLLGPSGNTLKAIELLTETYVLVQGKTVSVMGNYKAVREVGNIVFDCMKNIHPVYHIKRLMVKRELIKDEKLVGEDWERFLPKFKKNVPKTLKPTGKKNKLLQAQQEGDKKTKTKKDDTPFPPEQLPRKIDQQLESGEYFLSPQEKAAAAHKKKMEKQISKSVDRFTKRQEAFVAPDEPTDAANNGDKKKKKKKRKRDELGQDTEDAAALGRKLRNQKAKPLRDSKGDRVVTADEARDYLGS